MFFQIFLSRSIKAYICVGILLILHRVFFSERRPEEVMFLLTLRVYSIYYTTMFIMFDDVIYIQP